MGHAPDWMRQNMKSTGSGKIASASHRDTGNPFHGKSAVKSPTVVGVEGRGASGGIARFADGGPVEGADVGFWERFKAGNIDDPSSEAYRRWGQGARKQIDAIDETRSSTSEHWNKYKSSEPAADDTNEASHLQKGAARPLEAKTASDYDEIRNESYRSEPAAKPKRASKAKDVETATDTGDETARLQSRITKSETSSKPGRKGSNWTDVRGNDPDRYTKRLWGKIKENWQNTLSGKN